MRGCPPAFVLGSDKRLQLRSRPAPVYLVPFANSFSMAESKPPNSSLSWCMVALNTPSLPAPRQILETLTSLSGSGNDWKTEDLREDMLKFSLHGTMAAVALTPSPIPWATLEGPCETAWWWPDASARLRGHNSHLLVAMGGGKTSAVHRCLALTHLAAAVAAHVDAAGIYWGGGSLVHEPDAFLNEARSASPNKLPWHLWIDVRIQRNEDESRWLFTSGMQAFDKMEIEIPHSQCTPVELVNFTHSIIEHLLLRGAEIRDGHTIGRNDDEKITAAHAPSMVDSRLTVLRLDF
jgi:hypothetical protein